MNKPPAIVRFPVDRLQVGMFIHDLNCNWLQHNFLRNRFLIDSPATLQKIQALSVREVLVDTTRSQLPATAPAATPNISTSPAPATPPPPPSAAPVPPPSDGEGIFIESSSNLPPALQPGISTPEEGFRHARQLCESANQLMHDVLRDVRLGKQIELNSCSPVVDHIVDSIFEFPSAMLPLVQVKTRDEYTFQHSVAVSALAVAFGRVLNLPREEITELALGGLLHDVGKAQIPGRILNKPAKLDVDEFSIMKSHVSITEEALCKVQGLSRIAFNAAVQHHERYDGSGYPRGLKGEQISLHGQMLAIIDVYDAITSLRVYHRGLPPTEALRKMFEWGNSHFNPKLVQAFIKGIGIYPAGSLVRMESNRLGIVREVSPERLLQPVVQMIFDCTSKRFIPPEMVDLSRIDDKIVSHESFEAWQINRESWASA